MGIDNGRQRFQWHYADWKGWLSSPKPSKRCSAFQPRADLRRMHLALRDAGVGGFHAAFDAEGLLSRRASIKTTSLFPSRPSFLRMPFTRISSAAVK